MSEKKDRRKILTATGIIVIIIVAALAAYYVAVPPAPGVPEKLVVSVVGAHWAIIKFGNDPALDGSAATFIPLVYETLVDYDPVALQKGQYKIIPWLAESYTTSPDGLTWTFKLRKGIKFHTGNEMTADDVVYSYRRFYFFDWKPIAAYLPWPVETEKAIIPPGIESINKVDDYTVQIKLSKRIASFLSFLAATYWSIIDSKAVQAHEKTLPEYGNAKDFGYTWLGVECNDAGTGPYKVKKIEMTVRYEFELFDGWWGGPPELKLPKPQFKSIVYVPTHEDTDARLKLLKGDVHIVSDFLAETVAALKKSPGVVTVSGYNPTGFGLWMHTVTGPLKDWRVRKAIKMALNYTAITEVACAGGAVVAQGAFMGGMPGWEKTARYFPGAQYDEANRLLDEAGYPVQADGWRFHINMYLRPEPRWGLDFTKVGLTIRDDLAKVKIDAVPVVLHVSEYYAHVFTPSESMMWVQPFDTMAMPGEPTMLMSYWGLGKPWYFGFNATTQPEIADKIAKMEELFSKAMDEPNDEKRIALFQEIQILALEYGPYVTVANSLNHIGVNANLEGFFWGPKQLIPGIFYATWKPKT